MRTYETSIRQSGYFKQVFEKASHSSLQDAVEWILSRIPNAEIINSRGIVGKYGAIVLREDVCTTSLIAFYQ